jgi:hypothetical protein
MTVVCLESLWIHGSIVPLVGADPTVFRRMPDDRRFVRDQGRENRRSHSDPLEGPMLPFTRDQFLEVFAAYNEAIGPVQVAAYLLAAVSVALLFRPGRPAGRIVVVVLAVMWLWTGVAYHGLFFASINQAALLFAAFFVVEGVLLLHAALTDRLRFGFGRGAAAWIGVAFILYAAVLYPLIGTAFGHAWPEMPMFGVTPCPVTIFTFGILLLATTPVPRRLLVIPFLWSLLGGSAAILLDVPQDWLLLASGFLALPLILRRAPKRSPS